MLGKVAVSFELTKQMVGGVEVVGLSNLCIDPADVGKNVLQMIESIASPKLVVGFVDDKSVGSYAASGWLTGKNDDNPGGKWLVASDSLDESKFEGRLW
jgi:hypothetical protein